MKFGAALWQFISDSLMFSILILIPVAYHIGYSDGFKAAQSKQMKKAITKEEKLEGLTSLRIK